MLNLQPLIARLVDDVLRVARTALLAELREKSSQPVARPPRKRPSATGSRVKARPTGQAALPPPRTTSRPVEDDEPREAHTGPWSPAEITDPERLLVAAARAAHPVPARETLESNGEPPRSAAHATASAATNLRPGESLARMGTSGIVIRRAKRATT